ncbi:MAG: hypothetical protein RIC15_00635 [Vicingaceae bacterium]
MRKALFFLILLSGLFACELMEKDKKEVAIARVSNKFLYYQDIQDLLIKLEGDKDSATIVSNYINNWIRQELLLEKAELNLVEEQKDFQKLIEDYRRSLVIYAFQKEWIKYNLDTVVNEEEIVQYYERNKANFELKENIVKARYVVAAKNAPKLKELSELIKGDYKSGLDEFKDYCLQYAKIHNENDSVWMLFDDVLANVPLEISNKEDFLRSNRFASSIDSLNIYMLYISDYKIKSSISPLDFERERIHSIIINQRKLDLLTGMKEEMFTAALKKGRAEIFEP